MKKYISIFFFIIFTITFSSANCRFDVKKINRQSNYIEYNITNYGKDYYKVQYQIIGYDQRGDEVIIDQFSIYDFKHNETKKYRSYLSSSIKQNRFDIKEIIAIEN